MKSFATTDLAHALSLITAINHEGREKIMQYLSDNPDSNVTAIHTGMKLEPAKFSQLSKWLGILHNAGVVIQREEGNKTFYSINEPHVKELQKIFSSLVKTMEENKK